MSHRTRKPHSKRVMNTNIYSNEDDDYEPCNIYCYYIAQYLISMIFYLKIIVFFFKCEYYFPSWHDYYENDYWA